MNNVISESIHSFNGHFYRTAGVTMGFFSHPEEARRCANKITLTTGRKVQVFGSYRYLFSLVLRTDAVVQGATQVHLRALSQ